jgi:hypothetical protein
LRIGAISEHVAANPQDHRAVAQDQDLERRFGRRTGPANELLEQLPVGEAARGSGVEQRLNVAQDCARRSTSHVEIPVPLTQFSQNRQVVPGAAASYPDILGK